MAQLVFRLMLFSVLLAPFPFASVLPWGWGLLMASVGVSLAGWFYCYGQGSVAITLRPWQVTLLFAPPLVALLWCLVQAGTFAPANWNNPVWHEASLALGISLPGHISLTPDRTLTLASRLCLYGGVFWLAANLGRDPANARKAVAYFSWAVTLYAAYGLLIFFAGNHSILWTSKFAYLDDLTSTFVNRNNYATFAGLGLICVVARGFISLHDYLNTSRNKLERMRNFIAFMEKKGAIYLGQVFVIFSSLLLSHSRAGLAATMFGVLALFVAFAFSKIGARRSKTESGSKLPMRVALAFLGVVMLFYAASGQGIDARLGATDLGVEERPLVYHLTMEAISDQPLLGGGLGSFESVFRLYRTAKVLSIYDYAHDTYLETTLELGLLATLLLAVPIVAAFVECVRGIRVRRKDLLSPCVGIGASTLVWLHAVVDFSIQIPAVAVSYALLMGLAVAQSRSSRQ
jgi:hypothetical protein